MKLGVKINGTFAIIVLMVIASSLTTIFNLSVLKEKQEEILEERITEIKLTESTKVLLNQRRILLKAYESEKEEIKSVTINIKKNLEELYAISYSKEIKQKLSELEKQNKEINNLSNEITKNEKEIEKINKEALEKMNEMTLQQEKELEIIKTETRIKVNHLTNNMIVTIIVSIVLSFVMFYFVNKDLLKPLKKIMEKAKNISEGDLKVEDIEHKSKDEIGELAIIFNQMKNSLMNLISSIQKNSKEVTLSAEKLSKNTNAIEKSVEDVARRTEETSKTSKNSTEASKETTKSIEETSKGIQILVDSTQKLNNSTIETKVLLGKGGVSLKEAKNQMYLINNSTSVVNKHVKKLSEQIEEIENITKIIMNITEQTKLLSLNAAIEAARVGEHGKGFTVVAGEVKKLAETSKKSADAIVLLTKVIKEDTAEVLNSVDGAVSSTEEGVRIIKNVENSFVNVYDNIEIINEQVEEISSVTEELSASTEEITANANEINIGEEKVTSNINDIEKSMKEQEKTIIENNKVANLLLENATALQKEIENFKA